MTQTIIRIEPGPIFKVLGRDGQRWGRGWGDWNLPEVTGTCLHGAIRCCVPVKGDAYIVEAVGECFGFGTKFNDNAKGWDQIRDRIAQGFDVTDEMLATTFGPNWSAVVSVIRTIAGATKEPASKVSSTPAALRLNARVVLWNAAAKASRDAVMHASVGASRSAMWVVERYDASDDGVWDDVWDDVWADLGGAVGAVVMADLVGHHGFTQEHYDTLLTPWIAAFGDPFEAVREA